MKLVISLATIKELAGREQRRSTSPHARQAAEAWGDFWARCFQLPAPGAGWRRGWWKERKIKKMGKGGKSRAEVGQGRKWRRVSGKTKYRNGQAQHSPGPWMHPGQLI